MKTRLPLLVFLALNTAAEPVELPLARGRVRTTLNRENGTLTSTVFQQTWNPTSLALTDPLHLVTSITEGDPQQVSMPGTLGGPGQLPYSTFYHDLALQLPFGQFRSGEFAAKTLQFIRPKAEWIRYRSELNAEGAGGVSNAPPQLQLGGEPPFTVQAGSVFTLAVSATDPDGDVVTLAAAPVAAPATFRAGSGTAPTGEYRLEAPETGAGYRAVTFTARDSAGLTDSESILLRILPVNRAPVLTLPDDVTIQEGKRVTMRIRATDPDGDAVTLTAAPIADNMLFLPLQGDLQFAPDFTQAGTYAINCAASDGLLSDTGVLTVTVTDVPDPGGESELVLDVDPVESPNLRVSTWITGRVNAAAGSGMPAALTSSLITGVLPTTALQGESISVQLSGPATGPFAPAWIDGISSASFGSGITVQSFSVQSPTSATAQITIASAASPGTRGIVVSTAGDKSFAVPAFTVGAAGASLSGRLVDSETGQPLAGVDVVLQGTGFRTVTGADGSFSLTGLPSGTGTLLLLPPDHKLLRLDVELSTGLTADVGEQASAPTVYDPTAPDSVSLFSVIGRGFTDPRGELSRDAARDVIRDAFLLIGADEVGVLDEDGNQLNPNVVSNGLMSIEDAGVTMYADRLVRGDTVRLMEVLMDISFALTWDAGAPPTYLEWMDALQAAVNTAWADPSADAGKPLILAFNNGQNLSPNPPTLDGDTKLTKAQAFILVSGVMNAVYVKRDDWLAAPAPAAIDQPVALAAPSASSGTYTLPWIGLIEDMGGDPSGYHFDSTNSINEVQPGYEKLLQNYYLDGNVTAMADVAALIRETFPDQEYVEDLFERDPLNVHHVMSNLLAQAFSNAVILTRFNHITTHEDGTANLGGLTDIVRGPAVYYPYSLLPQDLALYPRIMNSSLAPGAPYIYLARETVTDLGVPGGSPIRIPAVEIDFYVSSADNYPQANPSDKSFLYRLWREEVPSGGSDTNLTLIRGGKITAGSLNTDTFAPHENDSTTDRIVRFIDPFPPVGPCTYYVDCIQTSATLIDDWRSDTNALRSLSPWFEGYLDMGEPYFVKLEEDQQFGAEALHPGDAMLNETPVYFSALSNPGTVQVYGGGSGLSQFGRIDLAADYAESDYAWISIPGYGPEDRGTGAIFTFDVINSVMLDNYSRPGFMSPGQVGLAVGSNRVFSVNAASEAAYGGKVFRWDIDEVNHDLENRTHVGQVNYFSRLIQKPNPSSLRSLRIGPWSGDSKDYTLLVADAMSHSIKKIDQGLWDDYYSTDNWDVAWHIVGKPWAENSDTSTSLNRLNFGPYTDMAMSFDNKKAYVTQGSTVVRTSEGKGKAESITTGASLFTTAAGCDMCERFGEEILFVADRAADRILRIPVADMPIVVPTDPFEYQAMLAKYTAFSGVVRPHALRIIENGRGLIYSADDGFHYERFGFSGRAEDRHGNPLVGAHVTLQSPHGVQSSTTDRDGIYFFRGNFDGGGSAILHVNHPSRSYTERVTVNFNCGSEVRPEPLVMVDDVLGEAVTAGNKQFETTAATLDVLGDVLPTPVEFRQTGGLLELTRPDGQLEQYALDFTGDGNQWRVLGIPLMEGDSHLVVRINASGIYEPGSSERFRVRRTP